MLHTTFEGDRASCWYNKCETESEEPLVRWASVALEYATSAYFHIFPTHIKCLYGPYIFLNAT